MRVSCRFFSALPAMETRDGTRVVRSLKFTHPTRQQRLMLVAAPRFAQQQYYDEWCYQPYTSSHKLCVSEDIQHPCHIWPARMFFLNRAEFAGYQPFSPIMLGDNVDANISRREFMQREVAFKTPLLSAVLRSLRQRDRRHPWLEKQLINLVGKRYVFHPSSADQSFVVLLPPSQMATAAGVLEKLGFEVSETIEADVGDDAKLKQLEAAGDLCHGMVLFYIWFLLFVLVINETKRLTEGYKAYLQELADKQRAHDALVGGSN